MTLTEQLRAQGWRPALADDTSTTTVVVRHRGKIYAVRVVGV